MNRASVVERNAHTIVADAGRTLWPNCSNRVQPLIEHRAEAPRARVVRASDLVRQAEWAKKWNRLLSLCCEATVREPDEEIENAGRGDQHLDRFQVRRNRVRHQLGEELLAEDDNVFAANAVLLIPDGRLAQEVEPRSVNHWRCGGSALAPDLPGVD